MLPSTVLLGLGLALCSAACASHALATKYWHLVLGRMAVAAGEAVLRPLAGALLAEAFLPSSRGLANGIFSWGVYWGYGLAFLLGIDVTSMNILGLGWRAPTR